MWVQAWAHRELDVDEGKLLDGCIDQIGVDQPKQ